MKVWLGQWKVNNLSPSKDQIISFLSNTDSDIIAILQMEYNKDFLSIAQLAIRDIDYYKDYHLILNQQIIGNRLNVIDEASTEASTDKTNIFNSTCFSIIVKDNTLIRNVYSITRRSIGKYLSSKGVIMSVLELIDYKKSIISNSEGRKESECFITRICLIGCNFETKDSLRVLQISQLINDLDYINSSYKIDTSLIFGDINNRIYIPRNLTKKNKENLNLESLEKLEEMITIYPQKLLKYDMLASDNYGYCKLKSYFHFPDPIEVFNSMEKNILLPSYKVMNTTYGLKYIQKNIINKHDDNILQIGWLDRFGWNINSNLKIKILNNTYRKNLLISDHLPLVTELEIFLI